MTLTTRLSVFLLAMLGVVLVGFSLSLYLLTGRYLHRQVGERLDAVLSTLAAAAEDSPRGLEWEPAQRQLNLDTSTFGVPVAWLIEDWSTQHVGPLGTARKPPTSSHCDPRHHPLSCRRKTRKWRSGAWQLRQRRF